MAKGLIINELQVTKDKNFEKEGGNMKIFVILGLIAFVSFSVFKNSTNELLYNKKHGIVEQSDKLVDQAFISGALLIIILLVMLILAVKGLSRRNTPTKRKGRRADDN